MAILLWAPTRCQRYASRQCEVIAGLTWRNADTFEHQLPVQWVLQQLHRLTRHHTQSLYPTQASAVCYMAFHCYALLCVLAGAAS